jgi:L-lactate dehydrogenase
MRFKNINIFGAGNIGLNICNLIIYEGLACKVNLITNQDIEGIKLDFINHAPFTSTTKITSYFYNNYPDADINIIAGGVKQLDGEQRINLIDRNKKYLDSIIRNDMKGEWIVITNPDDILAHYLLSNTSIPKNKISALGIALDNMRAKSIGITQDILGQHNLNIYTEEEVNVDEVAEIPYAIIHKKGYTQYGMGYVVLWYLKYLKNYKHQIVSNYNEEKRLFESTKLK